MEAGADGADGAGGDASVWGSRAARGAAVVLTTAGLATAPTLVAAQTLDDLDDADRRVERLEDDLGGVVDRYEVTRARIETVHLELEQLRRRADELAGELAEAERALGERARSAYMRGATASVEVLLVAGPSHAAERAGMLAALQRRGRVRVEQVAATRLRLGQTRELIDDREQGLRELEERLGAQADELAAELESARSRASRIRTLVSRQRRIDRGPQQGIYSCIFDRGALRFRDTWGAPRSGGRRHKGTDVFAAHDAPVYAITSGVVQRHSRSRLGGIGLYLRGDDGNVYYYAHLAGIEPGGAVGRRVVPGELIARNGSSGNASRSAPHVHFELHPGGGRAVNPHPWLAAACR